MKYDTQSAEVIIIALRRVPDEGTELERLWTHLLDGSEVSTPRPAYGVDAKRAYRRVLQHAREQDPSFEPTLDIERYFWTSVSDEKAGEALLARLAQAEEVESAYRHRAGPPPSHPSESWNDPAFEPSVGLTGNLAYLDAAPDGIDARFAWRYDGDGKAHRFGLVDYGWKADHGDLPPSTVACGTSSSDLDSVKHGTSSFGVACAVADNEKSARGIAPFPEGVVLAAYVGDPSLGTSMWEAVTCAADTMKAPKYGVLLLEAQVDVGIDAIRYGPAEADPLVFDAVANATAAGVVVVAAAGNGGEAAPLAVDLDAYLDAAGQPIFDLSFRDSKAIIVSAASATVPHIAKEYASHGDRIDAYGWGDSVFAPSAKDDGSGGFDDEHTTTFSGTSSASAIVAGAALSIMSTMYARKGVRMCPTEVRAAIRSAGTPVWKTAAEFAAGAAPICSMPDLRAIFTDELGVVPDVYVRDHVGDDGDPHSGPISASPDVFVRPTEATDPQAAFGEGSGTENEMGLGSSVTPDQTNYVYVRMRNRGGHPANGVQATVYWAPVSTLLTPDLWTEVGTTVLDVPTGDALTVASPIAWPKEGLPSPGHHCFVCVLDHPDDPKPDTAEMSWDAFRTLIRDRNNVTWRNFNVIDPSMVDGSGGGDVELPFMVPGPPDEPRRMRLEIVGRLPSGSQLELDIPPEARKYLRIDQRRHGVRWLDNDVLVLKGGRGSVLRLDCRLPPRSRFELVLRVTSPKGGWRRPARVYARQLDGKLEVGRVSWHIAPHRQPKGYRA